jgi:hypothetical protein
MYSVQLISIFPQHAAVLATDRHIDGEGSDFVQTPEFAVARLPSVVKAPIVATNPAS